MMLFREEPVTPVYRRWMCAQVGCNGELVSTGEGITRLSTRWKHRCGKCGHEDRADATYPRVAYLPFDAIGPDDFYKPSVPILPNAKSPSCKAYRALTRWPRIYTDRQLRPPWSQA